MGYANAYNIKGLSTTHAELGAALTRRLLHGRITAEMQAWRRAFTDSWPRARNDSAPRVNCAWQPQYDGEQMVDEMLRMMQLHTERNCTNPG
ncbi:MAG: hypothetical protein D6823_06870 [Chloroflexi bacterium]|jgi:hypothetical protein|nr:MAG: hypothetical protein D6823_06870 [Chloroflexota bacterium]